MPPGREMDADHWLERVYSSQSSQTIAAAYDDWAETYDADMLRVGYANTAVAAGLVTRWIKNRDSAVLEAGVGTGILGEVLSILGYRSLSGVDISEGMLAKAHRRGVYHRLTRAVLGETLGFETDAFDAVICFGVFTPGHAPCHALDELIRVTAPGGYMIFTVSAAAWRDGGFEAKLGELESAGRTSLRESTQEYRPMPLSPAESQLTTRAYIYQVL
jgi:predicted TPR repeat methyltransferase